MKQKSLIILFILVGLTIYTSACRQAGPSIRVEGAWVRPDPLWENAAGYFSISNSGIETDYLIGIRAEFAGMSMMHQTITEGDISSMVSINRVEIPAGEQVDFKPMDFHVMFMDLADDLELGQEVILVLVFEISGELAVPAQLRRE